MDHDVISDVLQSVRLTGAVFYVVDCVAPWVAEAPPAREIAGALMPAAQHVFEFHVLVAGECWAGPVGAPPVRVAEGELVAFPRGEPHVLSSAPGMRARPDPAIFARTRSEPPPLRVAYGSGGGPRAQIVCGFLGCDARPFNPLLGALPRVLRASRGAGGEALPHLVDLALAESRRGGPGSRAVLSRISELAFIDVVRRHVASLPPGGTGWFAGLRDEFVGKAIERLHRAPAAAWTLERLARDVGLSRSALTERFTGLVGEAPMHYLTRWRIQLASGRLAAGASVQEVAAEVGYASEAAFHRAFKKVVGAPPASWARAARGAEVAPGRRSPRRPAR